MKLKVRKLLNAKRQSPNLSSDRKVFQRLNPRKTNWIPPDGQFSSVALFVNK